MFKSQIRDTTGGQERENVNERERVRNILRLFQDMFDKFKSEKTNDDTRMKRTDLDVAKYFSENRKSINQERRVGHVPGIEVGDRFRYRTEMSVVGLHLPYTYGIDYMLYNGKNHAISVVDSGKYENERRGTETVIFCGHGGRSEDGQSKRSDQEMIKGNKALLYSMKNKVPVRLIEKKDWFQYKGLYEVTNCRQEPDGMGYEVFKFEMHRVKEKSESTLALDDSDHCSMFQKNV